MRMIGHNKNAPKRISRTPYRVELKFTPTEWEFLCEQGRRENTSIYNVLKHRLWNGTPLEDHSHHKTDET